MELPGWSLTTPDLVKVRDWWSLVTMVVVGGGWWWLWWLTDGRTDFEHEWIPWVPMTFDEGKSDGSSGEWWKALASFGPQSDKTESLEKERRLMLGRRHLELLTLLDNTGMIQRRIFLAAMVSLAGETLTCRHWCIVASSTVLEYA